MPQELDERVLMRKEEKPTLDGLHDLCFLLADNSLSWAPITQNPRVLDLGSGTGLWVREFAETRSPRKVVGVDLKFPESTEFPSTCSFVMANLENNWNVSEKFDYIHARFLIGCLFNWPGFFRQCYDTLSPGGWFEIFDVNFPTQSDDGTLKATSDLSNWNQLLIEAGQKCGRELTVAGKFKEIMTEIGFQNVTEVKLKVPVNPWPKDSKGKMLGELSLPIHTVGHERLGMDYLCSETGMTEKEVREKLVGVHRDMADPDIHSWWPFYAVYGQKP